MENLEQKTLPVKIEARSAQEKMRGKKIIKNLYTNLIKENDEEIELSEEQGKWQTANGEKEKKFKTAIAEGLAELEGLNDEQILYLGMSGEEGDIKVSDLKKHLLDMKNPQNPVGKGKPFRVGIIMQGAHSPKELEEIDSAHMESERTRLAEKLKQYPPENTLYYADLEDVYDPVSFSKIKTIKVCDAVEKLENDEADFWGGSSFEIISADKDFDPKEHLKNIKLIQKAKQKFLESIKNLDELQDILLTIPGEDPKPTKAYILRWDIITAKAEEIPRLMDAKVELLEPQEKKIGLPQK